MSNLSPYANDHEDSYIFRLIAGQLPLASKTHIPNLKLTRNPTVLKRTLPAARRGYLRVAVTLRELDDAQIAYRWSGTNQIVVDSLPPELIRLNPTIMDLALGREIGPEITAVVDFAPTAGNPALQRVTVTAQGQPVLRFWLNGSSWGTKGLSAICLCGALFIRGKCGSCGAEPPAKENVSEAKDALNEWCNLDPLVRALILPELESFIAEAWEWDELNEALPGRITVEAHLATRKKFVHA